MKKKLLAFVMAVALPMSLTVLVPSVQALAASACGGAPYDAVTTTIDIGCKGQGNPITDMAFAIIRFLSAGVGLVIVASLVYAGIQYTASRNDPGAVQAARKRIGQNVGALIIFIFAYAILNYLIPAGFFKQ